MKMTNKERIALFLDDLHASAVTNLREVEQRPVAWQRSNEGLGRLRTARFEEDALWEARTCWNVFGDT